MVPLAQAAARHARSRVATSTAPGLLALRHALAYGRPGLRGDDPEKPRSLLLVREGDGRLEAFGAGDPEPAVGWLAGQARGFALHAPGGDAWPAALRARVGSFDVLEIQTWTAAPPADADRAPSRAPVARLAIGDADAFLASAPPWALRGWGSYPDLIRHGAGFGVPHAGGFAALAWVFDQADAFDALGVHTRPEFRRLGLARASASALVGHVARDRRKTPLWSADAGNAPSLALARALGFAPAATETLLRWPPSPHSP